MLEKTDGRFSETPDRDRECDGPARVEPPESDEEAASRARARYRSEPMTPLDPAPDVARFLEPGERVLALRRGVRCERRQREQRADAANGLTGDLFVTSRRLVFLGSLAVSVDLGEIADAVLAGERLLLVMRDGRGVAFDVERPRLLRVEIAAARLVGRA